MQKILILDFGSQTTQLIARRVREAGVYCEIQPYFISEETVQAFKPDGVILSGGPETVVKDDTPRIPDAVFQLHCPILGICYGMQAMAHQLGGAVQAAAKREFGDAQIEITAPSALLDGIDDLNVWMSHGDHVVELPEGFVAIASSPNAPITAMACDEKRYYGVQFHPEVTHTVGGHQMIKQFVHQICGCDAKWIADNIIEEQIQSIREKVGQENVLLALSGGVDSSVLALLLHRAIGKQLKCVFVDTGLLRYQEAEQVMASFTGLGLDVTQVNAKDIFLNALKGEDCPETKRKIVGGLFIDVFEKAAKNLPNIAWLAQGTIYPDVIESAGNHQASSAKVIKSHHNVGGLPERLPFKLLEPFRLLFKDEVRSIGLKLGLPTKIVHRHPFPGPGLSVRILGEVKPEYIERLQKADHIFMQVLEKYQWYHRAAQAFAVLLPVKSVGVVGDARQHEPVIALRAVETTDFMTANCCQLPYELLFEAATRIVNEVPGVSRVTFDVTHKPPATIEWE